MKRALYIAVLLSLPLLAACNTFQGMGEDLQSGGRALSNAASDHKDNNQQ